MTGISSQNADSPVLLSTLSILFLLFLLAISTSTFVSQSAYPTNTTTGKMAIATKAIERIDNDPKLASRILSALKAGGTSALDSLLDHPAASFAIAVLEDWQQTKGS